MNAEIERRRRVATLLADTLVPIVHDHLDAMPRPAPVKVLARLDAKLVAAAKAVARSVDKLDQSRFSARERPARLALERAARSLRTAVRNRDKSDG